jgi:hypothetical protein
MPPKRVKSANDEPVSQRGTEEELKRKSRKSEPVSDDNIVEICVSGSKRPPHGNFITIERCADDRQKFFVSGATWKIKEQLKGEFADTKWDSDSKRWIVQDDRLTLGELTEFTLSVLSQLRREALKK